MVRKEEDVDVVRDDVYRTIERFQTTPVDEQRLADLKRRNKYSFLMHLDTPDNVAGNLARVVAITGSIEALDALYTHFQTITVQDIMEAAQKYLIPERRSVVILKGARS